MLLDELNAGRTPECADHATADLLAVAEWARSADFPVRPPQHILDETANRALAGLEAGQPKRTGSWWYSGALGTAAAVLLVIGLQMLPSWKEQAPAMLAPTIAEKPADIPRTSVVSEQPPASPPVTPAETAPAVKQNSSAPPPTPPSPSQAPETPAPAPVKERVLLAEEAPRTSQAKASYIAEEAKPPSPDPALTPLKLPGKTPDLVVIDKAKGMLRQIYDKGTPQEIIIVQRLRPTDTASAAPAKLPSPSAAKAIAGATGTTVVQVTIGDQEITVEGRRSRQELLLLAESLAP